MAKQVSLFNIRLSELNKHLASDKGNPSGVIWMLNQWMCSAKGHFKSVGDIACQEATWVCQFTAEFPAFQNKTQIDIVINISTRSNPPLFAPRDGGPTLMNPRRFQDNVGLHDGKSQVLMLDNWRSIQRHSESWHAVWFQERSGENQVQRNSRVDIGRSNPSSDFLRFTFDIPFDTVSHAAIWSG